MCTRFVVSGRVQGVFYRASTESEARRLGLVGWVRNCPDGTVELLACGDEEKLRQLERWLWDGPQFADVTTVEVERVDDIETDFSSFSVRY